MPVSDLKVFKENKTPYHILTLDDYLQIVQKRLIIFLCLKHFFVSQNKIFHSEYNQNFC